jgi:hypothetical protein
MFVPKYKKIIDIDASGLNQSGTINNFIRRVSFCVLHPDSIRTYMIGAK